MNARCAASAPKISLLVETLRLDLHDEPVSYHLVAQQLHQLSLKNRFLPCHGTCLSKPIEGLNHDVNPLRRFRLEERFRQRAALASFKPDRFN
jgi:hypothetical protein